MRVLCEARPCQQFLAVLCMMIQDFNRREAVLCFKWARMDMSDIENSANYTSSTHLTFPDFLEAIARTAEVKTMPDEAIDVIDFFRASVGYRGEQHCLL